MRLVVEDRAGMSTWRVNLKRLLRYRKFRN